MKAKNPLLAFNSLKLLFFISDGEGLWLGSNLVGKCEEFQLDTREKNLHCERRSDWTGYGAVVRGSLHPWRPPELPPPQTFPVSCNLGDIAWERSNSG